MKINHLSFVITAFCGSAAFAETVAVESPDGHFKLTIEVAADGAGKAGATDYSVSAASHPALDPRSSSSQPSSFF
ncbi:MAG: hypothetical protein ABIT76_14670 [Chthoniobacterales bacterium]